MRHRAPHLLSGGQKQRVAIAGALALRPACLVLDEPTAMLDPSGRAEVVDVVHKLNRELGMAVIWITHFMDEAVQSDRVVVMADGRIELDGTPKEVFTQVDRLRQLRLDVPPAVVIAERLRSFNLALPPGLLTLDDLVEALCQLR
jgi:energy-coupling factor transport system ATP-binding protein